MLFLYIKKQNKTKTQTHGAKCWIFMDFGAKSAPGGDGMDCKEFPSTLGALVMEAIATPSWLYSSMVCSYIEQHSRVSYVFKGPRLRITPAGASGLGDGKAYFVCTGFLSPLYARGPRSGSSVRLGTVPQWSCRAGSNSSVVILSPSPWNLPTVS